MSVSKSEKLNSRLKDWKIEFQGSKSEKYAY